MTMYNKTLLTLEKAMRLEIFSKKVVYVRSI